MIANISNISDNYKRILDSSKTILNAATDDNIWRGLSKNNAKGFCEEISDDYETINSQLNNLSIAIEKYNNIKENENIISKLNYNIDYPEIEKINSRINYLEGQNSKLKIQITELINEIINSKISDSSSEINHNVNNNINNNNNNNINNYNNNNNNNNNNIDTNIQNLIGNIKSNTSLSDDRKKLLIFALEKVGQIPYSWGGTNPNVGLDCSHFVDYVSYNALNDNLGGGGTAAMLSNGTLSECNKRDLKPGDLGFMNNSNEENNHVGIYLYTDSDGNDWYVHESGSSQNVVVSPIDYFNYYYKIKSIND